jgi:hypothetical protein
MGADHRADIAQDGFNRSKTSLSLKQDSPGFGFGVGVHACQADGFFPGYICFYQLDQAGECFATSADSLHSLQAPAADLEDGLDVESRAEETLRAADTPAAVKKFECFNCDVYMCVLLRLFSDGFAFNQAGPGLGGASCRQLAGYLPHLGRWLDPKPGFAGQR